MTRYIEGAFGPDGTPMTTSSGDEITFAIGQWADVTSGHRRVCKVRRGFGNDFTRGRMRCCGTSCARKAIPESLKKFQDEKTETAPRLVVR